MTDTAPGPQSSTTRPRWLAPLVILVMVAVALGAGIAIGRHDRTLSPGSTSQLTTMQAGCEQWAASSSDKPEDAWCSGMASWMGDRMGDGMMGSSMWDGPQRLRDSCRQWADKNPADAGSSASRNCDDMVTWMDDHAAGGWTNWMMNGR